VAWEPWEYSIANWDHVSLSDDGVHETFLNFGAEVELHLLPFEVENFESGKSEE
jgi:hypothetical protein